MEKNQKKNIYGLLCYTSEINTTQKISYTSTIYIQFNEVFRIAL